MIGNRLAYVALAAADPAACGEFLGRHLGLARTELPCGADAIPVFAAGESALAVFPLGHPGIDGQDKAGVHHLGFAVDDPPATAARLGEAGFGPIETTRGAGLGFADAIGLRREAACGVRLRLTRALAIDRSGAPLVRRIDHIGVASADNALAERVFCADLGLAYESRQTDMEVSIAVESFTSDKYGVVYHSRDPQPAGGLRVSFITAGDCELEFLQNFDPRHGAHIERGAPGNTRQDQGAITRFIASRGAGLHHIALNTADIDALLARLHAGGLALIDRAGRPGSRRALIGFPQPKATGGVLFHFCQR